MFELLMAANVNCKRGKAASLLILFGSLQRVSEGLGLHYKQWRPRQGTAKFLTRVALLHQELMLQGGQLYPVSG